MTSGLPFISYQYSWIVGVLEAPGIQVVRFLNTNFSAFGASPGQHRWPVPGAALHLPPSLLWSRGQAISAAVLALRSRLSTYPTTELVVPYRDTNPPTHTKHGKEGPEHRFPSVPASAKRSCSRGRADGTTGNNPRAPSDDNPCRTSFSSGRRSNRRPRRSGGVATDNPREPSDNDPNPSTVNGTPGMDGFTTVTPRSRNRTRPMKPPTQRHTASPNWPQALFVASNAAASDGSYASSDSAGSSKVLVLLSGPTQDGLISPLMGGGHRG